MENVKLITIQEQGSFHSFTKDQKYNFQNIVCLGKPNDTKEVKKNQDVKTKIKTSQKCKVSQA